jgi:hypothetical protein
MLLFFSSKILQAWVELISLVCFFKPLGNEIFYSLVLPFSLLLKIY